MRSAVRRAGRGALLADMAEAMVVSFTTAWLMTAGLSAAGLPLAIWVNTWDWYK
jgi:hypothetical protein